MRYSNYYLCLPIILMATNTWAQQNFSDIDYKAEQEITCVTCYPQLLAEGLYVGGSLGYDNYKLHHDLENSDNFKINSAGWFGNVLTGYGRSFAWFYYAGEISAGYSQARSNYVISDHQINTAQRTSLSIGLLPGLVLNDSSRMYVRISFIRTFFKIQEIDPIFGQASRTIWNNGLQYGLGLETAINPSLSLRAEYNYTKYDSFESPQDTRTFPSNNQFVMSLLWHFC